MFSVHEGNFENDTAGTHVRLLMESLSVMTCPFLIRHAPVT